MTDSPAKMLQWLTETFSEMNQEVIPFLNLLVKEIQPGSQKAKDLKNNIIRNMGTLLESVSVLNKFLAKESTSGKKLLCGLGRGGKFIHATIASDELVGQLLPSCCGRLIKVENKLFEERPGIMCLQCIKLAINDNDKKKMMIERVQGCTQKKKELHEKPKQGMIDDPIAGNLQSTSDSEVISYSGSL